ncbi:MAG: aminoacyl-histidine dipeptidase [Deltaproteobacteria bacterium]|nr:aminoacyl-histidine dipeptidase [Deltaproteobacteria bacterium]
MSHHLVNELEPKLLWGHFDAITQIPHPSGHEAKLREHIVALAKKKGLKTTVDATGNVTVHVPATPGREGGRPVVLQGHLDMVGEKNSDTKHDFTKDPIKTVVDGDYVKATGTTLGADNGIGVAAALAVMDDPSGVHGPLELLFTVDEETGLTGASNLEAAHLSGRLMVNLDSEEDGAIFISCAGGVTGCTALKCPTQRAPAGVKPWEIRVGGLKGGHSGLDINDNRANAIKLLAFTLLDAIPAAGAKVLSMEGGSKHNAIPREAVAVVVVPRGREEMLTAAVAKAKATFQATYGDHDPDLDVKVAPSAVRPRKVWTGAAAMRTVRLLLSIPTGVLAMSKEIPGLVETSNNLSVVVMTKEGIEITTCSRSSVNESLTAAIQSIEALGALAGAKVRHEGRYPGWRPEPDSPLLVKAKEVFKAMRGADARVMAIHAGLECGIIMEKLPGMKAISFGPALFSVHSPAEKVQISTVGPFYEYLKELLKALA